MVSLYAFNIVNHDYTTPIQVEKRVLNAVILNIGFTC